MYVYIYDNWCLFSYLSVNVVGLSYVVVIFVVFSRVSNYVSLFVFYLNMYVRFDRRVFWEYLNYKFYYVNFILLFICNLNFCVLLFNLYINVRI